MSGRTGNENRTTLAKCFKRDPLENYKFNRVENFGNVLAVVTSTLETLKSSTLVSPCLVPTKHQKVMGGVGGARFSLSIVK